MPLWKKSNCLIVLIVIFNVDMKATVDDLRRELWLRKREKLVWETKNGQLKPLKLMSEEHLENAINYFDRMEEMREIVLENQDILNT